MKNQKLTHKEILAQFTIENWNYDLIEGKAINESEKSNINSLIINHLDS